MRENQRLARQRAQDQLRADAREREQAKRNAERVRERDSRVRGKYGEGPSPRRTLRQHIPAKVRYHVLSVRRCQNCGWSVENGASLHVDHIIPVSKGGTNARDNLQALCAPCNMGKSDYYQPF